MHRFDAETIAALAEGTLDPEEARELEAQIAADPVATAELEAHRAALAAIEAAPAIHLTQAERSSLRATVAEAAGFSPGHMAPAEPGGDAPQRVGFKTQRTRPIPWPAMAVAGAALLTLVAIVPIAGLLTTQGSDDATASATAPLPESSPTTIAVDQASGGADTSDGTSPPAAAAGDTDSLDVSREAAAETTTTAHADISTIETTVPEEPPALDPASALELAALRADPEALGQLAAPPSPDTPCIQEASDVLGSGDLSVFEFSPTPPPPPESSTTTSPTSTSDAPGEPPRYRVFFTPGADPEQEPGPFVAFASDACDTPLTVP